MIALLAGLAFAEAPPPMDLVALATADREAVEAITACRADPGPCSDDLNGLARYFLVHALATSVVEGVADAHAVANARELDPDAADDWGFTEASVEPEDWVHRLVFGETDVPALRRGRFEGWVQMGGGTDPLDGPSDVVSPAVLADWRLGLRGSPVPRLRLSGQLSMRYEHRELDVDVLLGATAGTFGRVPADLGLQRIDLATGVALSESRVHDVVIEVGLVGTLDGVTARSFEKMVAAFVQPDPGTGGLGTRFALVGRHLAHPRVALRWEAGTDLLKRWRFDRFLDPLKDEPPIQPTDELRPGGGDARADDVVAWAGTIGAGYRPGGGPIELGLFARAGGCRWLGDVERTGKFDGELGGGLDLRVVLPGPEP